MLLWAYQASRSTDATLLREAARQTMIAVRVSTHDKQRALAGRAVELAGEAVEIHGGPSSVATLAETTWVLALISGDETHKQAAITAATALTDLDPHGIGPWRRLGNLLFELGLRDEAALAYERALENNANFELDPMRQLSEPDRLQLRLRSEDGVGR